MNTRDRIELPPLPYPYTTPAYKSVKAVIQEYTRAAIKADRQRRCEPVAWQFYDDGCWWNGDDRIKDHRKNTENAGYKTRDLYATPQPAEPDEERLAMEAVMESVDPATWPGLTIAQRCALGRFAKPQPAAPEQVQLKKERK